VFYGPKEGTSTNSLYKLTFHDSYLLLPSSLNKLSKAFKVYSPKDIFPHKFVSNLNLTYTGSVPEYKNIY
jgi:DNA polymerase type B, organellar and viral